MPLCLLVLQILRPAARQQGLCTNPIPGRREAGVGRTVCYPHGIAPGQPVGSETGQLGPCCIKSRWSGHTWQHPSGSALLSCFPRVAAEHEQCLSPQWRLSSTPNNCSTLYFCFSQQPVGWGLSPEPSPGVENRHVEEEEETWLWDAGEQGGGNYGTEEKKSPGISSHQLRAPLRVIGLQVPWPLWTLFTVCS